MLREKTYAVQLKDTTNCLIFDDGAYRRDQKPMNARIKQFCGPVSTYLLLDVNHVVSYI